MARLRTHLEARGVAPQRLAIRGEFLPQYLTVSIDYPRALWYALDDWVLSGDLAPDRLDTEDPLDRLGLTALIVREHEMAHFFSFAANPFATSIQFLSAAADSCVMGVIKTLRDEGAEALRLPLSRWSRHYRLGPDAAQRISGFEARFMTIKAVLGLLMFRPVDLTGTADSPWPEGAWHPGRWPGLCREIWRHAPAERVVTALDLHEGYAVTSEARGLGMHARMDFPSYYQLRRGLYGVYENLPNIVWQHFGGWDDLAAAILISCTLNFPAAALLRGETDWWCYDVSRCFGQALQTMKRLGRIDGTSGQAADVDGYIRAVFGATFPGFDPSTLLDTASRARIEQSFGMQEGFQAAVEALLPGAAHLAGLQDTARAGTERLWWRRFISYPLDNVWPLVIGFTDTYDRFCELDVYHQARTMVLNHLILQSLWDSEDLDDCLRWSFGGVTADGAAVAVGRKAALDHMVRNLTTYGLSEIHAVER